MHGQPMPQPVSEFFCWIVELQQNPIICPLLVMYVGTEGELILAFYSEKLRS